MLIYLFAAIVVFIVGTASKGLWPNVVGAPLLASIVRVGLATLIAIGGEAAYRRSIDVETVLVGAVLDYAIMTGLFLVGYLGGRLRRRANAREAARYEADARNLEASKRQDS